MPSALSNQNDYFTRRHRRPSSQSQTSLPDQIKATQAPQSPNRSVGYLPATSYVPSTANHPPRPDPPLASPESHPTSPIDPDDFYRAYHAAYSSPGPTSPGLHQEALRAVSPNESSALRTGRSGSFTINGTSSGQPLSNRRDLPATAIPTLKSRKPSVKNLVAQINATATEDRPPLPAKSYSRSHSRNISPVLNSSPPTHYTIGHRNLADPAIFSQPTNQRRPLFGEVLPTLSQSPQSAGYGIVSPRRRTASESSPMHSPNPMFPPSDENNGPFLLSAAKYDPSNAQRSDHRRHNSDQPVTPTSAQFNLDTTDPVPPSVPNRRHPPLSSRIPVSTRRMSVNSDSGGSGPSSRANSRLDADGNSSTSTRTVNHQRQQSSIDNHQRQSKITSPGRRGKAPSTMPPGSKSPSLRANIIAPPPKISPPLRSSRPRLPVSSASTAASRARMAEKFSNMQKMHNEKRSTDRRVTRPPELTDIDLKARRLKITQALTKSREADELRGSFQTGKKWEPRRSHTSSPALSDASSRPISGRVPVLTIDPAEDTGDTAARARHADHEDADNQYATQSALHAMQVGLDQTSDGGDSPVLGRNDALSGPVRMHLQTQFLGDRGDAEPSSALTDITVETEGTNIDPEPQVDAIDHGTGRSLLSHVMSMRENSPSTVHGASPQSPQGKGATDRADVESVDLVMRDTTYMDHDEAIRTGYTTTFTTQDMSHDNGPSRTSERDSWTSSFEDDQREISSATEQHDVTEHNALDEMSNNFVASRHGYPDDLDSYRNTMASDAYTIVNFVLQQHSSSGVVDQQFVDDVYHRVVERSPEIEEEVNYDPDRIEELCIREIQRRESLLQPAVPEVVPNEAVTNTDGQANITSNYQHSSGDTRQKVAKHASGRLLPLPSTSYQGHRYKSSLDSAEDWADTSPSVGDWMRFASENAGSSEDDTDGKHVDSRSQRGHHIDRVELEANEIPRADSAPVTRPSALVPLDIDGDDIAPEEYGTAIIRPPSHSPPPPPKDDMPSIESAYQDTSSVTSTSTLGRPSVPFRMASLGRAQSQAMQQTRSMTEPARSEVAPWESQDAADAPFSAEAKRLKQRKHVLRELVDTEFTYERDMRVLCDIYKQTAAAALSEDDIRVLFGNIEDVQAFSRDFLAALKQTVKPVAAGERAEKRKEKPLDGAMHGNSSSSTLASATKSVDTDASELQKDRETRVGDAFEGSLAAIQQVYTEYIRNRHAANQRLEVLQRSPAAKEWLKECRENSSDITNAWNLDALLVKPVQRITKYPLLLKELIDSSSEDHPDLPALKRAFTSITDINMRINDVKKHAELVDQVLNRKRGQSDSRAAFTKAFGRRAEKLRQHVGMTDMYEDQEYNAVRRNYDNNIAQLVVISTDCQSYESGISEWVGRMEKIAAAAEGWVDVGHSHHQQAESKLRQLAIVIRRIMTIALPDHVELLHSKVIQPMLKAIELLTRFKEDPKGLLNKRDKRLVDYAQLKNKAERGEKVDKKTQEKMDQWEALNMEAKDRMKKLLRATAHLVQTCQGHLVRLQMSWMGMVQQKLSDALCIPLTRLTPEEIEKEWRGDFDHCLAQALTLSICNGSLLLEAANMTSFLSPGTTLVGDDSPRQSSWSSANKRSVSITSETSTVPTLDNGSRPSGTFVAPPMPADHFDRPYPYANGRTRAASTTSGKTHGQSQGSKTATTTSAKHVSASGNYSRPGTSPGLGGSGVQEGQLTPRLSVETHSPLVASFSQQGTPERPPSSSTFFSATAQPMHAQGSQRSAGSGVFSSAMPMSDSPVQERQTEAESADPAVLFTAASVYEFNIDRDRREAGFPYLTYVAGEIFDVIGERGELWLAKNQDDPHKQVGWIWNKHFAKLQT